MSLTADGLYPTFLLALMAWREARGQSPEAQLGVIWSAKNRAAHPSWWGSDIPSVILKPYQYSSFNANDPDATKFPEPMDPVWKEIVLLAIAPGSDPTNGATHYFDDSLDGDPPQWSFSMKRTVKIDRLNFFKAA